MGDYDATYAFTYHSSGERDTPTSPVGNDEVTQILQAIMEEKMYSGEAVP